ncbi:MAG: PTS lactose/cellobiose transporter subunit IIA [Holdemanella sp.]|nr:PTS lactose/cellobiose transporter subunit IIA [Holdemanella sp.]
MLMKIMEMISCGGMARSMYIQAIEKAKEGNFEEAAKLIEQGGEAFEGAHKAHAGMLAESASDVDNTTVSLFLVHAEDQMMCAETFRVVAEQFIDVYKELKK